MARLQRGLIQRGKPTPAIREMCSVFVLNDEKLKHVMQVFLAEVKKGLGKETHSTASVKCYNTFVHDMPTDKEKGEFLALVLGSSRIRVVYIRLGDNVFETDSNTYDISPNIRYGGTGTDLFDFLAQCIVKFCKEHNINYKKIPLGMTIGYPTNQTNINTGILRQWGKGFHCSDSVGQDVVQMLKRAFFRKKAPGIEVLVLINDTTSTLVSCAWKNPACKIGLIVGDGFNLSYVENTINVELFPGKKNKPNVVINTECGAFGDGGELEFIRTDYDRQLDQNSNSPNIYLNEKMISGMYLGELVRLVLRNAIDKNLLLGSKSAASRLHRRKDLRLNHVSDICSDEANNFTKCLKILAHSGVNRFIDEDLINVRYICECVLKRSAYLVAAQVATLVNKMGYETVTVAVDGSVFLESKVYRELVARKVKQLVAPSTTVELVVVEQGSGQGAALIAAVAVAKDRAFRERNEADGSGKEKVSGIRNRSKSIANERRVSKVPDSRYQNKTPVN